MEVFKEVKPADTGLEADETSWWVVGSSYRIHDNRQANNPTPFLFDKRLVELADLLSKLETLRLLYKFIRREYTERYHVNSCYWLKSIERASDILNRRVSSTLRSLEWGV